MPASVCSMRNILALAAAAFLLAACSSEEKKPASSGPAQAGYSIPSNDPLPIYDSPSQPAPASSAPATTPAAIGSTVEYTVVSGDSLWKIARRHKTTVEKIMLANDLRSDVIKPGQKLLVPVP